MRFPRRRRIEEGVNLTPMIDVVFLLLIFFMVSTSFTKENRLTLDIPTASGEKTVKPVEELEVLIDEFGRYRINDRALPNDSLQTLQAAISRVSPDAKLPLVIVADSQAPHAAVVRVMDAAGRLGFTAVQVATLQAGK